MMTIDESTTTGVSFALTEEQKELRRVARDFAAREIRPLEAECDADMRHAEELIAKAHELGLMNLHVPEEYGGPGLPTLKGCSSARSLLGLFRDRHVDHGQRPRRRPVIGFGSDEQKRTWLTRLVESPILCSFGLSEPGAGSDVASLRRRPIARATSTSSTDRRPSSRTPAMPIRASSSRRRTRAPGVTACGFIVPMDAPGVTIEKHLEKMGQRATDTSAFALQDVRVPAENRIGEGGDGFKIAMATLDATRPGTAVGAVGVAQAAYEHAVEYAKERVTFDVPIAMHRGVNFMIADMATEIEASRLPVAGGMDLDQGYGRKATMYSSTPSGSPRTRR